MIDLTKTNSFSDIFEDVRPYTQGRDGSDWSVPMTDNPRGTRLSPYLTVNGASTLFRAIDVKVRPEIAEWLKDWVIDIDYEQMYWRVYVRDDGKAAVRCCYNAIIGGRSLGFIDASTIPNVPRKQKTA